MDENLNNSLQSVSNTNVLLDVIEVFLDYLY